MTQPNFRHWHINDICWAKLNNLPFYPAQIINPLSVKMSLPQNPNLILVKVYTIRTLYVWVHMNDLKPFSDSKSDFNILNGQKYESQNVRNDVISAYENCKLINNFNHTTISTPNTNDLQCDDPKIIQYFDNIHKIWPNYLTFYNHPLIQLLLNKSEFQHMIAKFVPYLQYTMDKLLNFIKYAKSEKLQELESLILSSEFQFNKILDCVIKKRCEECHYCKSWTDCKALPWITAFRDFLQQHLFHIYDLIEYKLNHEEVVNK
eukprot:NODE_171_length_14381_cov_0.662512.p7 type:complete len:262 gc:universal NODE_171_length_14381_cov_0.662512:11302-10517(-)